MVAVVRALTPRIGIHLCRQVVSFLQRFGLLGEPEVDVQEVGF